MRWRFECNSYNLGRVNSKILKNDKALEILPYV